MTKPKESCPFCGSGERELHFVSNGEESVFVECGNCGASGPTCDNEEQAWAMWNKRDY